MPVEIVSALVAILSAQVADKVAGLERVDERWTRKDVLAHLEAWERRVVDNLAVLRAGGTPDGSAGHVTGYVRVADIDATLAKATGLGGSVIMPKFSPDGTRLVTAGGSQSDRAQCGVTIWGVRPGLSWLWGR